jgi:hypothetical protein
MAWIVSSCPPTPTYEGFNLRGAASQVPSRQAKNRLGTVEATPEPMGQASEVPQTPPRIKAEEASDSSSNKRERIKRRVPLKNIFMRDAVPPEPASCPPFPPGTPQSRFSFFREAFSTIRERTREPVRYSASRNNILSREDASSLPGKVNHTEKPPAKPALPAKSVFAPFAEETQRHTKPHSTNLDFLEPPVPTPVSAVSYDMADAPARAPSVAAIYTPSTSGMRPSSR